MLQFFEHFERECYVAQGDKTLFEGELLIFSTLVFSKTNHSTFVLHITPPLWRNLVKNFDLEAGT